MSQAKVRRRRKAGLLISEQAVILRDLEIDGTTKPPVACFLSLLLSAFQIVSVCVFGMSVRDFTVVLSSSFCDY